jgi:dCTP deaminase
MILPDYEIKRLIEYGVVSNTCRSSLEGQINPWSLDVRLGNTLLIERTWWQQKWDSWHNKTPPSIWLPWQLDDYETYRLKAKEFVLGNTIEHLDLPDDIGAELYLKSSRAREGYDHAKAVWIDPGFKGSITLELRNNLRFNSIDLWRGLPIAQLVFYRGEKPDRSYRETGRYNGFTTVQQSLG